MSTFCSSLFLEKINCISNIREKQVPIESYFELANFIREKTVVFAG